MRSEEGEDEDDIVWKWLFETDAPGYHASEHYNKTFHNRPLKADKVRSADPFAGARLQADSKMTDVVHNFSQNGTLDGQSATTTLKSKRMNYPFQGRNRVMVVERDGVVMEVRLEELAMEDNVFTDVDYADRSDNSYMLSKPNHFQHERAFVNVTREFCR